ncbi:MAG: FecR domain-containing protein [Methylococcaceae bacterium]|nr:FecR domain-containing protein [Methylococcaceae bacterium]
MSILCLALGTSLASGAAAMEAPDCTDWLAKLASKQGKVDAFKSLRKAWLEADLDYSFCFGDKVRTWEKSRAQIHMKNETFVRLDQNTTLAFSEAKQQGADWVELLRGAVYFISRVPYELNIKTPFVNATIKGTEFAIRVNDDETRIDVFEGKVAVENPKGKLDLGKNQSALVRRGEAPMLKLDLKPEDAVQWTLYYPPVFDSDASAYARNPAFPVIKIALDRYHEGDIAAALSALSSVPLDQRDQPVLLLETGLLLAVGRSEQAEANLRRLLDDAPHDGRAQALLSIIELAHNHKDEARVLAKKALENNGGSASAHRAMSYVHQAFFELDLALLDAKKAVESGPADADGWARVAELELALGNWEAAQDAAEKAVVLQPGNPLAQAVKGFALLGRDETGAAEALFDKAIELDSSASLPRFGLGLAKINAGDLDGGTEEISIAAALDPRNALIRSYLGKAYYEQKRGKFAQAQYGLAIQFDPKDPTAYFYDAIHKQTENRPIEALQEMHKAVELNDNRAVYRSRQMLDDDSAARGAALGRIFNQVGFQRLGQLEAFKSLESNPANYTAHRLLSDTYQSVPRHEFARVSELLQSQLLQPINITPVQPQQAENNLLTVSGLGPADAGMNEFNPLFARNGASLLASGIVGSFDTYGNETVLSAIHHPVSLSLGQTHLSTHGFRNNDDIDENLYSVFLQGRMTPDFNAQMEYRHREVENGFLGLRFAPTAVELAQQNTSRRRENSDVYRFGAHWSPSASSDWLASMAYQDLQVKSGMNPAPGIHVGSSSPLQNYGGELQYLFRHPVFDAAIGGGHFEGNGNLLTSINQNQAIPLSVLGALSLQNLNPTEINDGIRQSNGYAYFHVRYPNHFTWTLGHSVAAQSIFKFGIDTIRLNPKVGLTWRIRPETTLRLAYFRNQHPGMVAGQTLEPVQVAGFNQLYDDPLGSRTTRYGIALDHRFDSQVSAGIELSHRDLDFPFVRQDTTGHSLTSSNHWTERLYRAYWYWAPWEHISLRTEYTYEEFINRSFNSSNSDPASTLTHTLPITLAYFSPTGWFASLRTTYVNQQVDVGGKGYQSDDFTLVDTVLGYRLPNRLGLVQLEVKNLFDQSFRYQSIGLRSNQVLEQAPFFPDRSLFARITLAF